MHIKCIQPPNLPLKGKTYKHILAQKVYPFSDKCFMQVLWEISEKTCMYIIINQLQSEFDKPHLYGHTNKYRQTDTLACMCAPTLTPTQKMSLWSCVYCSRRLFTICRVDAACIIVSHWTRVRLYQSVTQRDMTPDAALTSATVAFTFGCCSRSGGRSKKCGHLWQQEHKLTPSLTLTVYPTVFFPAIIWNSSFFLLLRSHTICLLCSLSSCRLVRVHFCALPPSYLCVFFVFDSAS